MSAPTARRGFLRGLVSLPLIGGGVTLIGAPSAVAEPVSREMLSGYSEWLRMERQLLHREMFPDIDPRVVHLISQGGGATAVDCYFIPPAPASWRDLPQPSTRAALVLAAVGCDWREGAR